MRKVIERPCAMPIVVETNENHSSGKYPVKLTVAGEVEFLTREELSALFKAVFVILDELDDREDKRKRIREKRR